MATAKHKTIGGNILPINYRLRFEPDFKTFKFIGNATITVEIKRPARSILLNASELDIRKAFVTSHGKRQACTIRMHKDLEEISLDFADKVSGRVAIAIEFTGTHNDNMDGFYRSRYDNNGKTGYLLTTQLEAFSARKAFPCIDEPEYKATFDASLVIDKKLSAISNMPIKSSKPAGNGKKEVTFYTTPVMSTYLLYLGVGEYDIRSGKLGKLPIRIIASPGKGKDTALAMEYTKKFVKFFNSYFGIPYQLPKLDMIAIPDFAAGAMENWGAITFRDIQLLSDPKNASVLLKRVIAETVAHELAHQWFGDLVTMRWWDDLWLNESFATFMSYKAMEAVYPKWEVDKKYILETISTAFTMDQLKTTHPINMPVNTTGEIKSLFDAISYQKGGTVLAMIEDYVGKGVFRNGVHNYLKKHSYSNATKEDLWDSISAAAGMSEQGKNLKRIARAWIETPGYPIINVRRADRKRLNLEQERYLLVNTKRYSQSWPIPVHYILNGKKPGFMLLNKRLSQISINNGGNIKLNYGQKGLYRVRYPAEMSGALGSMISSKRMDPIDAWGLENDMFAMSRSGRSRVSEYTDFIDRYCIDGDFPLNVSVSGHLSGLESLFKGRLDVPSLRSLNVKYHRRLLGKLGWVRKEGERDAMTLLRASAISVLGFAQDNDVVARSRSMFKEYADNGKPIDPNIRGAVFAVVAYNGDAAIHEMLIGMYRKFDDGGDQRRAMRALASFTDKRLLKKSLDFSLSKDVRLQDAVLIPLYAASMPAGRDIILQWTKDNWKDLMKRCNPESKLLEDYVENLSALGTNADREEVVRFFSKSGNMRSDIDKAYAQTLEFIDSNIRLIEANK